MHAHRFSVAVKPPVRELMWSKLGDASLFGTCKPSFSSVFFLDYLVIIDHLLSTDLSFFSSLNNDRRFNIKSNVYTRDIELSKNNLVVEILNLE